MDKQTDMIWTEQAIAEDKTFLRVFGFCIEYEKTLFGSIQPFVPTLTIHWTKERFRDRQIVIFWGDASEPAFGVFLHFSDWIYQWTITFIYLKQRGLDMAKTIKTLVEATRLLVKQSSLDLWDCWDDWNALIRLDYSKDNYECFWDNLDWKYPLPEYFCESAKERN